MADGRRTTAWGRLSDDAQNILEHLIGIWTEALNTIEIEVGQHPRFSSGRKVAVKPTAVDPKLFQEIKTYVESDRDRYETLEIAGPRMTLRLKDSVLDVGAKP